MVGNPVDGGSSESGRHAVLGEVSEAELDAFVSKLRTDKNHVIPPAPASGSRWNALAERLHRGMRSSLRDAESDGAREDATRHAWYAVLHGKISGPLEFAALREQWEHGALGPDSLCWREGFPEWESVCRVPELAEALAPLPREADVPTSDAEWDEITAEEDFPLKGADALRILVQEEEAVLAPDFTEEELLDASFVLAEPVAPVQRVSLLSADTVYIEPEARSSEPGVPHVAAAPVTAPAPVEVRWRTGLWLALLGGLMGGLTVALVLALMGLRGSGPLAPSWEAVHASKVVPASTTSVAVPAPAVAPVAPLAGTSNPPGAATVAQAGQALAATLGSVPTPALQMPPPTPVRAQEPVRPAARASSADTQALAPAPVPARPVPPKVVTPPARVQSLDFEDSTEQEAGSEAPAAKEEDDDELLGPDEDFARELDDPPAKGRSGTANAKPSVWVPPAPTPREAPASLAQSDIFEVVLANKGDITACASAQKPEPTEDGARVVVRWSILPSGQVTDVTTETGALQGTPFARCIEGKVRAWTFPKHAEQGPPVRFPFVF